MRIWDLPPSCLCRQHLLGEHREIHALWTIITEGKKGYSRHPETLRWKGKLAALHRRHEALAGEMARRAYRHRTPLDKRRATGLVRQDVRLMSPAEQAAHLISKRCGCTPTVRKEIGIRRLKESS
jgi:hypothetical protein